MNDQLHVNFKNKIKYNLKYYKMIKRYSLSLSSK